MIGQHYRHLLIMCVMTGGIPKMAAGVVQNVDPSFFGLGSTAITFSEVPVGTQIPFSIDGANFIGLSGSIRNDVLIPPAYPPSPSGPPYLETATFNGQDIINVQFTMPQSAAGAYFDVQGNPPLFGIVVVDFYSGPTLLGTLAATPNPGTFGGFVGGNVGSTILTRVDFRDIDPAFGVSFRIDDLLFVPEPTSSCLFLLATLFLVRSRERRSDRVRRESH